MLVLNEVNLAQAKQKLATAEKWNGHGTEVYINIRKQWHFCVLWLFLRGWQWGSAIVVMSPMFWLSYVLFTLCLPV